MTSNKIYIADVYLSAFLVTSGLPTKLEPKTPSSSKILFVFDKTDDSIYKLISEFTTNGAAPIRDFIENYKRLRSQMYELSNHGSKVVRP
jgi:Domain of unknown function (DUF5659)